MFPPRKILVLDHNLDSGNLITRLLGSHFPESAVSLVDQFEAAAAAVDQESIDAVVLHQTGGLDCISLTKCFRHVRKDLPLIAISTIDRSGEALDAGATGFITFQDLLRCMSDSADAPSVQADVGSGERAGGSNQRFTRLEHLKCSLAVYESLINYRTTKRRLLMERRRGTSDSMMVAVDDELELNERTLASLHRAVEITKLQVEAEERSRV